MLADANTTLTTREEEANIFTSMPFNFECEKIKSCVSHCWLLIAWHRTLPLVTNTTVGKCELFQIRASKSRETMTFPLFPSRMVGQPALHRSNRPRLIWLVDRFKALYRNWLVRVFPGNYVNFNVPLIGLHKERTRESVSSRKLKLFLPEPVFYCCVFNKGRGIANFC